MFNLNNIFTVMKNPKFIMNRVIFKIYKLKILIVKLKKTFKNIIFYRRKQRNTLEKSTSIIEEKLENILEMS